MPMRDTVDRTEGHAAALLAGALTDYYARLPCR